MERQGARKAAIDALLANPDIYAVARKVAMMNLHLEQANLLRDLETLESEWLEQQAVLESRG